MTVDPAAAQFHAAQELIGARAMAVDPATIQFHAADVFVLPSIHEPFGIVVLEAWAAGRPVIASRVGGIPDFLDDGKNGLLFESDDKESFIRAYGSLTAARAQEVTMAARNKVIQYTWQATTERLVDTYRAVISEYHGNE